jgi:voltage-gated potassium channel
MNPTRRLLWGVCILVTIIAVGVIGYMIIEGWSFTDALYMTIITITTVGYAEVHPLTSSGQIFSIFLIVGGVGGALYILSSFVEFIIEGRFGTTLGRRRMKASIAKLKGHFILCGYGRVGQEIAHVFNEEGIPFVVIDSNQVTIAKAEEKGYLCLLGNATNDEMLKEAGIEQARGLVAAVGSDSDNTYITLSARGLRSDLFIEARSCSSGSEVKLERAGANRVISPHAIGGWRMAMLALRPAVVDFIDTVAHRPGQELQMENIEVGSSSSLVGLTLEAAHHRTGTTVLAISKRNGKLMINPSGEETIDDGDRLIVIGSKKQLAALESSVEGGKG